MATASYSTLTKMSEQDRLHRKIAWQLIPMLMLCYLLASLDRSNVAFAKLEFSRDLGRDHA
jgi:sugar phosphate permease